MKRISLHKVMAKLAEEQRVELALVDDFKKVQDKAIQNSLGYIDEADAAKGFLSKALDSAEASLKDFQRAEKLHNELEAKFKELGIDVPAEAKFNRAAMQSTEMDVKRIRDAYQGFSIRR
jgi:hypothetical protein